MEQFLGIDIIKIDLVFGPPIWIIKTWIKIIFVFGIFREIVEHYRPEMNIKLKVQLLVQNKMTACKRKSSSSDENWTITDLKFEVLVNESDYPISGFIIPWPIIFPFLKYYLTSFEQSIPWKKIEYLREIDIFLLYLFWMIYISE